MICVRGLVILKCPLELEPEIDVANDVRREGAAEDIERVRPDTVRVRNSGGTLGDSGVLGLVASPFTIGFVSPSVHCKCKMADLVAHWQTTSVNVCSRRSKDVDVLSSVCKPCACELDPEGSNRLKTH